MAVLSSTWIILLVPLVLVLSVSASPVDHHHHHSESGDDDHHHHHSESGDDGHDDHDDHDDHEDHHNHHDDFSGIEITNCAEDCKDLLEVISKYDLSLYICFSYRAVYLLVAFIGNVSMSVKSTIKKTIRTWLLCTIKY